MRYFFIFALFLSLLTLATDVVAAPDAGDLAAKKALILRLYEVQPPRKMIDAAIEAVASGRYGVDTPAREEFVSRLQVVVDYDVIEQKSTDFMVEIFTVPELQAMVDYYSSETGQSIQEKMEDYKTKMVPELRKMMDAAVIETITRPNPAEAAEGAK